LLSQQAVGARERNAESGRRFHSLLPRALQMNFLTFSILISFVFLIQKLAKILVGREKYFVLTAGCYFIIYMQNAGERAKFACRDKRKKHMKVKEMDVVNSANCVPGYMKVSTTAVCVCIYTARHFSSGSAAVNEATVAFLSARNE
jgi:hypothetical protein